MHYNLPSARSAPPLREIKDSIYSNYLLRTVTISVIIPATGANASQKYPLLLLHDGQDFPALSLKSTLESCLLQQVIDPLVVVGVHADKDRIYEYGTAHQPDYANRGNRAGLHTRFVLKELLPFLEKKYNITSHKADRVIGGFSLGGLMALDLAWNHSEYFSKVGVFSGALWWRQKAYDMDYQDTDRIMHLQIRESDLRPDLKFWFQTGTHDETDDRDGDGIIDSIDDTLDCIAELERKGFRWGQDIRYLEVKGGEHNPATWAKAMPHFLIWAFGEKNK